MLAVPSAAFLTARYKCQGLCAVLDLASIPLLVSSELPKESGSK